MPDVRGVTDVPLREKRSHAGCSGSWRGIALLFLQAVGTGRLARLKGLSEQRGPAGGALLFLRRRTAQKAHELGGSGLTG